MSNQPLLTAVRNGILEIRRVAPAMWYDLEIRVNDYAREQIAGELDEYERIAFTRSFGTKYLFGFPVLHLPPGERAYVLLRAVGGRASMIVTVTEFTDPVVEMRNMNWGEW